MTESSAAGKGWIAFAVINALIIFFGLSYIFFPMGTVVEDGNQTTGLLDVPREIWGTYLVISAVAMLAITLVPYRQGLQWAWTALLYEFAFLAAVAFIEPDFAVPTLFAIILAVVMVRSRRRFFPGTSVGSSASEEAAGSRPPS